MTNNFEEHEEEKYLQLMRDIMRDGLREKNRTATDTFSVFGRHLSFDMSSSFPLFTTKKVSLYCVFQELMFFLRGQTDNNILAKKKTNIWSLNADSFYE